MDVTELGAMPKTRLVAVVRLLDWLPLLSDGRVSVPEHLHKWLAFLTEMDSGRASEKVIKLPSAA